MNRRRFKKWAFDNDGYGSETADEEFDRMLSIQEGYWCENGEDKVAVQEATKIRTISGQGIINKEITALREEQQEPGPRASRSRGPFGGGSPRSTRRHDRRGRRDDSDRRPKDASIAEDSDEEDNGCDQGDDNSDSDGNDDMGDERSTRDRPRARSLSRSTRATARQRRSDGHETQDECRTPKDTRRSRPSTPTSTSRQPTMETMRGTGRLTPFEFMQEKAALSKRMQDCIQKATNSRSLLKRVELLKQKLTPGRIDELDYSPDDIKDQLLVKVSALRDVAQLLEKTKTQTWEENRNRRTTPSMTCGRPPMTTRSTSALCVSCRTRPSAPRKAANMPLATSAACWRRSSLMADSARMSPRRSPP